MTAKMSAEEMRRLNLGISQPEPYTSGQRDIPASTFNRKLIPVCHICEKEPCDFFEYKGTVEIFKECGAKCDEKASNIRLAEWKRRESGDLSGIVNRQLRTTSSHA